MKQLYEANIKQVMINSVNLSYLWRGRMFYCDLFVIFLFFERPQASSYLEKKLFLLSLISSSESICCLPSKAKSLVNSKIHVYIRIINVNIFVPKLRFFRLLGSYLHFVSDICFSYITPLKWRKYKNEDLLSIKNHPLGGIRIHLYKREPHAKVSKEGSGQYCRVVLELELLTKTCYYAYASVKTNFAARW